MVPGTAAAAKEIRMELPAHTSCESIQIRELQCELQIQKLSHTLETMTTQYTRFRAQLNLLDAMLEKEAGETGDMFGLCMQLHRERVLKQLGKCSPMEQALVRTKIALLGAETNLNRSVRQSI